MHIPLSTSLTVLYLNLALLLFPAHTLAFDMGPGHNTTFNFGFKVGTLELPALRGNCGVGGGLCSIGNGFEVQAPDTTPFYQGQVVAPGGKTYWHIIIGDPNSDFALETSTEVEFFKTGSFGSYSGGQPTDNGGFAFTSGTFSGNSGFQDLEVISGNGWDPLSNNVDFTGNGSGDPI